MIGASGTAAVRRTIAILGAIAVTACDRSATAPDSGEHAMLSPRSVQAVTALAIYRDRAAWEAAVAAAGGTVQNFDFSGLTLGRVTQTNTDYGSFRIIVDRVATSSVFANPGIDIFPDASCSLGSGDCDVFTFNVYDPTTTFDGPRINQLVFPQPVIAFGGDFIQAGVTASGTPTGPVTLRIGSETMVLNDSLDAAGNGFYGFVAPASDTISFTFVKSGTIQNDIFQVYNPAYAVAPTTATPEEMIGDLQATVAGLGLAKGTADSFNAKLRAALNALDAGNSALACTSLQDLINAVNAVAGKKISATDAASLIAEVNDIRAAIGC